MSNIEVLKAAIDLTVETVAEATNFMSAESTWEKLQIVMGLSDNVIEVAQIDVQAVYAQYKALDAQGMAALKAHVAMRFDLKDDALEAKIESTFNWLLDVAKLLEGGLGLAKLYA